MLRTMILTALLCLLPVITASAQDIQPLYGQEDFTSGSANQGGIATETTLNTPTGIVIDSDGGITIADTGNHRVLYYMVDGNTLANQVYGQADNFSAHIVNNSGTGYSGPPNEGTLSSPTAVAIDTGGSLYVADEGNHRVLVFANDGGSQADRVYGQFGNLMHNVINNDGANFYGEPTANNLGAYIGGLTIDSQNGLYVADSANHRVLYFANDGDATADRVYGQCDIFVTAIRNNNCLGTIAFPTEFNLNFPTGLAVDSTDGLLVADRDNNRVLYFANDGDTAANQVWGQFGQYTTNAENNDGAGSIGGPNPDNLSHPNAIAVAPDFGIYIADTLNNRVLYYANDGDTTANQVWGQFDDFMTGTANNNGHGLVGSASANNLYIPSGLALDNEGNIYVTDTGNHRALVLAAG